MKQISITKTTERDAKGEKVYYTFANLSEVEKNAILKGLEAVQDTSTTAKSLYKIIKGLDD